MILHFLGDSAYSNKFVEYVNNNFSSQEHKFVFIYSNELKHITQESNVLVYKSNSFFDSITDSYIPLLQMLERLQNDGVTFTIGLVIPPVLP